MLEFPGGKQLVGPEAKGTREKHGQKALLWFPWEGMGEAGQADLGLAGFSGFLGVGTVTSCVLSGPGVSTAEKWCL